MDKAAYQELYENATPQERTYLKAKRDYYQIHRHHEALRVKIHKTSKLVNALTAELNNQSSKLQRMNEDMARTIERLRKAKEVYGPLRQQWKERHQERAGQ
jgi:DNA-binding transcriptional regulator GbsR (MarR family)